MASSGLLANGRVDLDKGDEFNEEIKPEAAVGGSDRDQFKNNRIDRLKNNHIGMKMAPPSNIESESTAKTINNSINDNSSTSKTNTSSTQAIDKTYQRTSTSAIQDIKGSDNDRLNTANNNNINETHNADNRNTQLLQNSISHQSNSSIDTEQTKVNKTNTNQEKQEQEYRRRDSNSCKTSPSGSQQKVGGDLSGTTTVSKFKEKRPEPLKLSSNLNQEIPLDLSVRSASNVPTDASGSVFGLLCANQLATLETPRILWQDNELLLDNSAQNITSSASIALSPLASSGIPPDSSSRLRLFSSTSSSASTTQQQRNSYSDRNVPMSVGLPCTPITLKPATPLTPDSVMAAAAHFAASSRYTPTAGRGAVGVYSPALGTIIPISPARTHHLARNLVSTATDPSSWSQPPRRSCSTENISSLLTSAAAMELVTSSQSTTTTSSTKSSLASAAAARRLLDVFRYQHLRVTSDLLGLDHSGTKRISPLATNSLTAVQGKNNVVTNSNLDAAATDGSRSHSSASSSSGSRFSYSSQQIAAARLTQRLQQEQQPQQSSSSIVSWSKIQSINSPRGANSDNNGSSANVSPLTPTNVASATANLLNIHLNSPNSNSNNSTLSNIDSLGGTLNENQQKPMSMSISSLSDLLAASSAIAAANMAEQSPKELAVQHPHPMTGNSTAVASPIVDPLMSSAASYGQSSIGSSSAGSAAGTYLNGGFSTSNLARLTQQSMTSSSNSQLGRCPSGGSNSTTLNTPTLISPNQLKAGHLSFLPSPTLSPLSSVFELPSPLLMFPTPATTSINGSTSTGNPMTICRDESSAKNNNSSQTATNATGFSPKGFGGTSNAIVSGTSNNSDSNAAQTNVSDCGSVISQGTISSAVDRCATQQQGQIRGANQNAILTKEMPTNHPAGPIGNSINGSNSNNNNFVGGGGISSDKDKRVRYDAHQTSDPFAQLITSGEDKMATAVIGATSGATLERTPSMQLATTTTTVKPATQANATTRMDVDVNDVVGDNVNGGNADGVEDEDDDDIEANESELDESTDEEVVDGDDGHCLAEVGGGEGGHSARHQRHVCDRRRLLRRNRRRRCIGDRSLSWSRSRKNPLKQTITLDEPASKRLILPNRPATAVPQILVSESSLSQQQNELSEATGIATATLFNATSLNTGLNRIEKQQQQKRQQHNFIDKRARSPRSFRSRINLYHGRRNESSSAPPEVIVGGVQDSCSIACGRHTPKAKLKTLSTNDSSTCATVGSFGSVAVNNGRSERFSRDQQSISNETMSMNPDHGTVPQSHLGTSTIASSGWTSGETLGNRSHQALQSSQLLSQNPMPTSHSADSISVSRSYSASSAWNSCYQQQQVRATGHAGLQPIYGPSTLALRQTAESADVSITASAPTGLPQQQQLMPASTRGTPVIGRNSSSGAITTEQTGACNAIQAPINGANSPVGSGSNQCCPQTTNFDNCSAAFVSSYWRSHSAQQLNQQQQEQLLPASCLNAHQQQSQMHHLMTAQWNRSTNATDQPAVLARGSLMSCGTVSFGGCENTIPSVRSNSAQISPSQEQSISVGEHLHRCGSSVSSNCGRSSVIGCNSASGTASTHVVSAADVSWLRTNNSMRHQPLHLTEVSDRSNTKNSMNATLQSQMEPYSSRSLGELFGSSKSVAKMDLTSEYPVAAFEHAHLQRSIQPHSYHQRTSNQSSQNCSSQSTTLNSFDLARREVGFNGTRTASATPTKMMLGGSTSVASGFSASSDTALAGASGVVIGATSTAGGSRPDSVASANSSISLDLESFKNVALSGERNPSILSTPNRHPHVTQPQQQQQYTLSRPSSVASNNTQLSGASSSCIAIRRRHCTTPHNRTSSSASSCGSGGAPKKYHCNQCNKSFTRSDMLTRHRRLHSGDRPFQCNECKQEFSRSDHLSTHMRTHTGEKPYKCKLCCYSACRKDMITRHMKVHNRSVQAQIQQATRPTPVSTTPTPMLTPSYQPLQLLYSQQQQRQHQQDSN